MTLPLAIVAALAHGSVIGRGNRLPWHIPTDLRHFKELSFGKPVIMGRATFAAIGTPLPGRTSIVLSRTSTIAEAEAEADDVIVARDPASALSIADTRGRRDGAHEIIVAGGAQVFEILLPLTDRLHLTLVDLDAEGDTHFPVYDPADWQEIRRERPRRGPRDEAAITFVDLRRRRPVTPL